MSTLNKDYNSVRNSNQQYDLVEIFKISETRVLKNCNVASLAIVDSVDDRNVTCRPFPIREGESVTSIIAYKLNGDMELSKNDIVLVIYTDRDFRGNINNTNNIYSTNDNELHKVDYGVIVMKKV
jgi:hypothetical protein